MRIARNTAARRLIERPSWQVAGPVEEECVEPLGQQAEIPSLKGRVDGYRRWARRRRTNASSARGTATKSAEAGSGTEGGGGSTEAISKFGPA